MRTALIVLPVVAAVVILALGSGIFEEDGGSGGGSATPIEVSGTDSSIAPPSGRQAPARVERIVDGDTVIATVDGREERVRYIGIDTPESAIPDQAPECFGNEAAAANGALVDGADVTLVIGAEPRDQYGRLLAYVYAGSTLVNAELVRAGYAETLEIAPNTALAGELAELEDAARDADRGLWSACR